MRNMQPKDKAVRVHQVIKAVELRGPNAVDTVVYTGYGNFASMKRAGSDPSERGWMVEGVGPYKKAYAIEQCAALCKAGKS